MAHYIKKGADGLYHCPHQGCGLSYAAASSVRRHYKSHGHKATTLKPTSVEEKLAKKREAMRASRLAKANEKRAVATAPRELYTSQDAEERGVHEAAEPLLEYRASRIEGAGNGLFARELLLKSDVVTRYCPSIPEERSHVVFFAFTTHETVGDVECGVHSTHTNDVEQRHAELVRLVGAVHE